MNPHELKSKRFFFHTSEGSAWLHPEEIEGMSSSEVNPGSTTIYTRSGREYEVYEYVHVLHDWMVQHVSGKFKTLEGWEEKTAFSSVEGWARYWEKVSEPYVLGAYSDGRWMIYTRGSSYLRDTKIKEGREFTVLDACLGAEAAWESLVETDEAPSVN